MQTRDPNRKLPDRAPTAALNELRDRIKSVSLDIDALSKSCSVEAATGFAFPSPGRPAVRLRAPAPRHHYGGLVSTEKRRHCTAGHAGTNGEAGNLGREPGVTLSKSHRRSTKSTRGGSALAPAESPNVLTSHICSRTLLYTFTSPLSERTSCVPVGCGTWKRVHFHLAICRSFRTKLGVSHDHCRSPL